MHLVNLINMPGWDCRITHDALVIEAPNKKSATKIAEVYADVLEETAFKLKGKVKIGWRHCQHPIEFFSWMAQTQLPEPHETAEAILSNDGKVFSLIKDLPVPLLKRMVNAGESELPWSIIRNSDQRLIILNTPMSNLIATPKELATQRIVSDYWLPGDWEELQEKFRLHGHFTWRYSAGLNAVTWADLETDFERFEVDGAIYGQNIIYRAEVVPFPQNVLLAI